MKSKIRHIRGEIFLYLQIIRVQKIKSNICVGNVFILIDLPIAQVGKSRILGSALPETLEAMID